MAQMSSSAPSAQARSVRMSGFHSLPIFARHGTARTLRRIAAKLLVSQLSGPYRAAQSTTLQKIVQGTEIRAIPIFSGCTVEPKSASVAWAGAWHRLEFEFQWQLTAPPAGAVFFFVGLVLVGEVPVRFQSSLLPEHFDGIEGRLETRQLMDSVFVSYSRKDVCIVEELERAFRALGLRYLRDVRELRAGQEWAAELLNMIDRAEAFQLCWSRNAKRSVQVDQEWRHALHSHVTGFIRPLYWEQPMPEAPNELAHLHFAYYPGVVRAHERNWLSRWIERFHTRQAVATWRGNKCLEQERQKRRLSEPERRINEMNRP